MLSVRRNGRKMAFRRSRPYQRCLVALALLLIAPLVCLSRQEYLLIHRNDRDVRKQRQDKTVYLHSRIDVSGSSL